MAKKVTGYIKLQLPAGRSDPGSAGGPRPGPARREHHGVRQAVQREVRDGRWRRAPSCPVVITVYADRSFSFILKTPPAAVLIKKKLGLDKGSAVPNKTKVGKITQAQLAEIAKVKMPDLNAGSLEAAVRSIAGSARSMGVEVVD